VPSDDVVRINASTGSVVVALTLGLAAPAQAQYYEPQPQPQPQPQQQQQQGSGTTDVEAAGNPFSGGLAFNPSSVRVRVGQKVRWTNTDPAVPHTATETHQLWDLAGDYGAGPFPRGFGPGESRERVFESGTHQYLCKVHPEDMKGTVTVPLDVSARSETRTVRRRGRSRRVRVRMAVVRWASAAPANELAFDVQRRRPGGAWRLSLNGTKRTRWTFRLTRSWELRARLRSADSKARATDWSPVSKVSR
jgi:plastocyanin